MSLPSLSSELCLCFTSASIAAVRRQLSELSSSPTATFKCVDLSALESPVCNVMSFPKKMLNIMCETEGIDQRRKFRRSSEVITTRPHFLKAPFYTAKPWGGLRLVDNKNEFARLKINTVHSCTCWLVRKFRWKSTFSNPVIKFWHSSSHYQSRLEGHSLGPPVVLSRNLHSSHESSLSFPIESFESHFFA